MEYTIHEFAALARVSTRTLRWYHEIGLLLPARINRTVRRDRKLLRCTANGSSSIGEAIPHPVMPVW